MCASSITADELRKWKGNRKIPSLTAYDYPMAKLLDEIGIPLILVGDSLGMVVLGYPDTTHVTMDDMLHHTAAAARAVRSGLLAADLPFESYSTPAQAVENAKRLVQAGAKAVKAEGGRSILPQVQAVVNAGIPFLGHLGMLPQHVLEEGGYHIKGKQISEREALFLDAQALVEAGAFGVVLELVTPPVAKELTQAIPIPTIGIGSGPDCDGQILVTSDLVGTYPWFTPRFVKQRMQAFTQMREAIGSWAKEI